MPTWNKLISHLDKTICDILKSNTNNNLYLSIGFYSVLNILLFQI